MSHQSRSLTLQLWLKPSCIETSGILGASMHQIFGMDFFLPDGVIKLFVSIFFLLRVALAGRFCPQCAGLWSVPVRSVPHRPGRDRPEWSIQGRVMHIISAGAGQQESGPAKHTAPTGRVGGLPLPRCTGLLCVLVNMNFKGVSNDGTVLRSVSAFF